MKLLLTCLMLLATHGLAQTNKDGPPTPPVAAVVTAPTNAAQYPAIRLYWNSLGSNWSYTVWETSFPPKYNSNYFAGTNTNYCFTNLPASNVYYFSLTGSNGVGTNMVSNTVMYRGMNVGGVEKILFIP